MADPWIVPVHFDDSLALQHGVGDVVRDPVDVDLGSAFRLGVTFAPPADADPAPAAIGPAQPPLLDGAEPPATHSCCQEETSFFLWNPLRPHITSRGSVPRHRGLSADNPGNTLDRRSEVGLWSDQLRDASVATLSVSRNWKIAADPGGPMRREDLIVALLCLATSATVLVESVPRYFGARGALGSGAYPCYVALLLAICGLSFLIQWLRGNRIADAPPFFPRGRGGKLLACTAGSLVVHRFGTDLLGFGLASLLLMIYQMRLLGRHRWWTTLVLSSAFIAAVTYAFRGWLYMALPRGVVGF